MTYFESNNDFNFCKTNNVLRASEALLCSINKFKSSLWNWVVCTDVLTNDVLFFIPRSFLDASRCSEAFWNDLKRSWNETGFTIIDEKTDICYVCNGETTLSCMFRLQPSA